MVKPGIYKHTKGGLYEVVSVGKCSETKAEQVIYRSLQANHEGEVWVRPLSEWQERFTQFDIGTLEYHFDKIALLVIKDRKVLMARSKGIEHFYMPGGKRDKGESDVECLVRECKEELGIDVDPTSAVLYGVFSSYAYVDKPLAKLSMYQANYTGTPTPTSEIEEIGWLAYSDRQKAIGSGRILLDELYWKGLID